MFDREEIKLDKILDGIVPVDREWIIKARERTAQLLMPARALGRLHDISERLCGIQKTLKPSIERKAFLVMAGDHGVVKEGVSAFPQEVTGEMIKTFLNGGAGINVLAGQVNADVFVVDMGIVPNLDPAGLNGGDRFFIQKVAKGTANLSQGPAMTREEAEKSILTGFQLAADLFNKGIQILGTGDMGIGNTTPSAAIGTVLTGSLIEEMVGRGTGVDDKGLFRKQEAIRKGIEINQPNREDGLDVLSKVGGFEIGGIAGCVLAGAYHKRPVVIDGFISTAGALVAHALCPAVVDYLFAGHCSEELGHRLMLRHLGLEPILDLGMRLGEGTGGALAMCIIEGAVRIFTDMLTFEQAGVTGKE
ncbi:MAG: nicotinate-nucleotide--dimethylbenzimidazole phosphoribosyltransferase [Desulfobacteraceae bacterium]|nr:nicotinate-nucleotide--dimethylbenzimidazole phosphoribosyltransferase [Desulfobacteraceae bacterium]